MTGPSDRFHPRHAGGEGRFTLIEVLVVVVVLGTLIGLGTSLYPAYRRGANDRAAAADLRKAISLLEQCHTDFATYPRGLYPVTASSTRYDFAGSCTAASLTTTSGTVLTYHAAGAGQSHAYILSASNTHGTGKVYCYASATSGAVERVDTAVSSYAAHC